MTRLFLFRRAFLVPLGAFVLLSATGLGACRSVTAPLFTRWEGTLNPVHPYTVGGLAAAVTQYGRTEVSIRVEDAEPGITLRWSINNGDCESQGQIRGGTAVYPSLSPSQTGAASAKTTISELFKGGANLAAWVYLEAGGGSQAAVACGVLSRLQ